MIRFANFAKVGFVGSIQSMAVEAGEPPAFVRLASHPMRWRLLRELVQSDRAVKELVALVGEPQNLVSYHLRLASRRRAGDGASELGRPSRQLLRDRPRCLPGSVADGRRSAASGVGSVGRPGSVTAAATFVAAAACAVPVHRQQREVPDRRGVARTHVRRCGRRRQCGEQSQAASSECGARDAQARGRHRPEPQQARRRIRRRNGSTR